MKNRLWLTIEDNKRNFILPPQGIEEDLYKQLGYLEKTFVLSNNS